MTTATTKALATYEGYRLVQYVPSGETRVEHAESKTCSQWLTQSHQDAICDDDLDDAE